MSDWIDVSPVEEFGEGQARIIDLDDDTTVAVFNIRGTYYAIENVCTHDSSPLLLRGSDPDDQVYGDQIVCPRHGARFSICTGEALSPPAYEPTDTFPVQIRDGVLQVRDPRDD